MNWLSIAAIAASIAAAQSPPVGQGWERLPARPGDGSPLRAAIVGDYGFVHGTNSSWWKPLDSARWRTLRPSSLSEEVFDGRWMVGLRTASDFTPRSAEGPFDIPGYRDPFKPGSPARFLDDAIAWRTALNSLGRSPNANLARMVDEFDVRVVTGDGMTFLVYTKESETMLLLAVDSLLPTGETRRALRAIPPPRGKTPYWDSVLQNTGHPRPVGILGGILLANGADNTQWMSLDSGKTWEAVWISDTETIESIVGGRGDTLVVMLSSGNISKSYDKGKSWSINRRAPPPSFSAPPVLARGRLWGVHQGNLLESRTSQASWTLTKAGVGSVAASSKDHLLAVSTTGVVWESNPGDSTWMMLPDTTFPSTPGKIRSGSNRVVVREKSYPWDLKILENGKWRQVPATGIDDFEILGDAFYASSHYTEDVSRDTVLPHQYCNIMREDDGSSLDCDTHPMTIPYQKTWYSIARTRDFQTWDTVFRRAASPFETYEIYMATWDSPVFEGVAIPGYAQDENSLLNIDSLGRLEIRLRTKAYVSADAKLWKTLYPSREVVPPVDTTRVRVDEFGDVHVLRTPEQTSARRHPATSALWSIRGHRLALDLANHARVRVERIDPLGRSVNVIEEILLQPGRQFLTLDGRKSGVGIYRVWIDGAAAGQILNAEPTLR